MTQETSEIDFEKIANLRDELVALNAQYTNEDIDAAEAVEAGAPARGITLQLLQIALDNPTAVPVVLDALGARHTLKRVDKALERVKESQKMGHFLALVNSPYANLWGTDSLRRYWQQMREFYE